MGTETIFLSFIFFIYNKSLLLNGLIGSGQDLL